MKIYPVVHLQSPEHALDLSKQALDAGADGVFLIDHLSAERLEVLDVAYSHVRRELGRSAWIGVNYLSLSPSETVLHLADVRERGGLESLPDAFWTDDASMDATDLSKLRDEQDLHIKYFGGVAFKYTPTYTDNPADAAHLARKYGQGIDIVTTSGPGTGYAADARKVEVMKEALKGRELALASGVSLDNIEQYRQYVDHVLAASSIETASYSGVFVDSKLRDLVQAAHNE